MGIYAQWTSKKILAEKEYLATPVFGSGTIEGEIGEVVVLYKGKGVLKPWGPGTEIIIESPGRLVWKTKDALWLHLLDTDPTAPIHDIHIIPKKYEHDWKKDPTFPECAKTLRTTKFSE